MSMSSAASARTRSRSSEQAKLQPENAKFAKVLDKASLQPLPKVKPKTMDKSGESVASRPSPTGGDKATDAAARRRPPTKRRPRATSKQSRSHRICGDGAAIPTGTMEAPSRACRIAGRPPAMLRSLTVRGFALLEDVRVELEPGLNVVTGETGAGKSLLVGALAFCWESAPMPRGCAREPETRRSKRLFELEPGPSREELLSLLDEKTGSTPDDGVVVLSRTLDRQGRARVFANNRHLTRDSLREITSRLVTVHGQAENSTLARPATQRDKLDAFVGFSPRSARQDFARARAEAVALQRELDGLLRAGAKRLDRLDLLRFQSGGDPRRRARGRRDGAPRIGLQTLSNAERIVGIVGDTSTRSTRPRARRPSASRRPDARSRSCVRWRRSSPRSRIGSRRRDCWYPTRSARRGASSMGSRGSAAPGGGLGADRPDPAGPRAIPRRRGGGAGAPRVDGGSSGLSSGAGRARPSSGESWHRSLRNCGKLGIASRRRGARRRRGSPPRCCERSPASGWSGRDSRWRSAGASRPRRRPAELATSTEAGFDQVEFELAPNPGSRSSRSEMLASRGELARRARDRVGLRRRGDDPNDPLRRDRRERQGGSAPRSAPTSRARRRASRFSS